MYEIEAFFLIMWFFSAFLCLSNKILHNVFGIIFVTVFSYYMFINLSFFTYGEFLLFGFAFVGLGVSNVASKVIRS